MKTITYIKRMFKAFEAQLSKEEFGQLLREPLSEMSYDNFIKLIHALIFNGDAIRNHDLYLISIKLRYRIIEFSVKYYEKHLAIKEPQLRILFKPMQLVPEEKSFTQKQMIDALISMDQAINPEEYKSSRKLKLGTEDFLDLAVCKASEFGIQKEFKAARKLAVK